MTAPLRIGDIVPHDPPAAIVGAACEPRWNVMVAKPQCEARLRDWMEDRDVLAWFPTVERVYRNRFNPSETTTRPVPVVTGYVLCRFEREPIWHAILGCRFAARYVSSNDLPVVVSEKEMARMEDVPHVLARIKMQEEARLAADRAAHMPVAGQMASIEVGIFAGRKAMVEHIRGQYAQIDLGMPALVQLHVTSLRRMTD